LNTDNKEINMNHYELASNPPSNFQQDHAEDSTVRRMTIWSLAIGLVVITTWASVFNLDEVTKGHGKVIPSSREQVVQSLDPGILSELFVKEGEQVEEGQILLRIDDARSGPVYREAMEKWFGLAAQAARLRAEAYSEPLKFPEQLLEMKDLIEREEKAYKSRKKALDEQINAMRTSMNLVSREIAMISPLVKQGIISQVEVIRLSRQRSDIESMIAERMNRYYTDANNELVRVETELAMAKENALARQDTFKRTIIRSPMRGIVKNIQVTTIGAVVPAGQNILEIIPVHDEMIVEGYIKPSEIAFVKKNQPVMVKLSAYDFNKYGGMTGVLEHISADTFKDDTKPPKPGATGMDLQDRYYKVLIKLTDQNLERNGKRIEPTPGMTADIEIRTGEKTVLEYVFRPLMSVSQALRER
jgi:adhesin transport system membrane fusion protein